MGNLTFVWGRYYEHEGRVTRTADITFSSSYATNGDTWLAADIEIAMPYINDLTLLEVFLVEPMSAGASVYLDKTNKKLKLYNAAGTEATNASNQSTVTVRCMFRYESFHGFDDWAG